MWSSDIFDGLFDHPDYSSESECRCQANQTLDHVYDTVGTLIKALYETGDIFEVEDAVKELCSLTGQYVRPERRVKVRQVSSLINIANRK